MSTFITNIKTDLINRRLIPLEATRGIAAIIVLIHHFYLAFMPLKKEAMEGHWYYIFFNGTGAVYFFFVLSGFVLCWSYFHTGNLNLLKVALFKRLPRLAAPVLITTCTSFMLFYFGLYFW
jgi:peptidoglycan/LPS O-acetylase OafA/YrhL